MNHPQNSNLSSKKQSQKQMINTRPVKVRRALISVSDKTQITELAKAFSDAGVEIVATGNTAKVIVEAGISITPIEAVSGAPEAFQGRMKTLSFPVCSGILYRRGNESDEADLKALNIQAIDAVVVNFYPFDEKLKTADLGKVDEEMPEWTELVDIGGPTMVRAAAKNFEHVLVLTDPARYSAIIEELESTKEISFDTRKAAAQDAWKLVHDYDRAIHSVLGPNGTMELRYGENSHQKGILTFDLDSPVAWNENLTKNSLSYNNIMDFSGGYQLISELQIAFPDHESVVILKHNNPCGVSSVPRRRKESADLANKSKSSSQLEALENAWAGDPVSAFGGVVLFSDPIEIDAAEWLSERFIELVAAPGLTGSVALDTLLKKRKNLKALRVVRYGECPKNIELAVPGGILKQSVDLFEGFEAFECKTKITWPEDKKSLAQFGILVCKLLKSNAVCMVGHGEANKDSYMLIGAGQGQPNRIEALKQLAVPRARTTLSNFVASNSRKMEDLVFVSDAFFPFRDTVDSAADAGIRFIVQPGGSIKDQESVDACDENGVAMVFTGRRHFRH